MLFSAITDGVAAPTSWFNYSFQRQEMQTAFHQESLASGRNKLLLTAAVSAGKSKIDSGYDVPVIAK